MVSKNEHALRSICPLARGLDCIGDHWTLLIVRDLSWMGKHEYREMLDSDEGISSNILSDRLQKLQDSGLVASIPHPESGRRKLYYLTEAGKDLIPIFVAIGRWANKHFGGDLVMPKCFEGNPLLRAKDPLAAVLEDLKIWEAHYLTG